VIVFLSRSEYMDLMLDTHIVILSVKLLLCGVFSWLNGELVVAEYEFFWISLFFLHGLLVKNR
jgi:hypothetical protein